MFSGRSADSIFGRQHTRSRINKLYLLAYLHTMALSFFISLFVTYTDIANRQTTNIFFGFLGIHSSDAREKREKHIFVHNVFIFSISCRSHFGSRGKLSRMAAEAAPAAEAEREDAEAPPAEDGLPRASAAGAGMNAARMASRDAPGKDTSE